MIASRTFMNSQKFKKGMWVGNTPNNEDEPSYNVSLILDPLRRNLKKFER